MGSAARVGQSQPTLSPVPLNFLKIKQPWFRVAAKAYLAYCLPIYAEALIERDCRLWSASQNVLGEDKLDSLMHRARSRHELRRTHRHPARPIEGRNPR
jgi:hypothetical protein